MWEFLIKLLNNIYDIILFFIFIIGWDNIPYKNKDLVSFSLPVIFLEYVNKIFFMNIIWTCTQNGFTENGLNKNKLLEYAEFFLKINTRPSPPPFSDINFP